MIRLFLYAGFGLLILGFCEIGYSQDVTDPSSSNPTELPSASGTSTELSSTSGTSTELSSASGSSTTNPSTSGSSTTNPSTLGSSTSNPSSNFPDLPSTSESSTTSKTSTISSSSTTIFPVSSTTISPCQGLYGTTANTTDPTCQAYMICIPLESGYKIYRMKCPNKLVFRPSTRTCVTTAMYPCTQTGLL
ncbi:cell wall integrity and stress response component 4-like [Cotesia glomerata]|uniref:cell wall integrity and stress response component 4-like n=1 Tax=Cotesia glomerata TaxID=32391 RepID=UPI001D004136|nr:cell wall integrity and stress response component 4-like [Cotesia glomerata]